MVRPEIRPYIMEKLRGSSAMVTAEEVLIKFPDLNRRDLIWYFQRMAEQDPRLLFKSGRKGRATRLEQSSVIMATTLVELAPDNPKDGKVIPKNENVNVLRTENGLYLVQQGITFTWAEPDEISFFKK